MWTGILFVGGDHGRRNALVLDSEPARRSHRRAGDTRYAQTMAFTTLMSFNVQRLQLAVGRTERLHLHNRWLWVAIVLSLVLQVAVIYIPVLQQAFSTVC